MCVFSEFVKSGALQAEDGRLVSRLDWLADTLQETVIECRPGLGEATASVSFNVVEDWEYEEEYYDYDYELEYSDVTPSHREEIVLTEAPPDATHIDLEGDSIVKCSVLKYF